MKPTIAQKSPYPIDIETGKTYYYCSCGNSKNNLFVMDRIQVHLFHLLHTKLKKLKQLIFVDVNNRLLSRFVTEHIQKYKYIERK